MHSFLTTLCVNWFLKMSYDGEEMQAATNPLSDGPWQPKILLGNQKFKVTCPNGQLKCKQGQCIECELIFCHYFWHLNNRHMCNILFQNRLKISFITSFIHVGSMSQRKGVLRFYKQYFNKFKFGIQKSGTIRQLIYDVRLSYGAASLEKNCCTLKRWFVDPGYSMIMS